MARWDKFQGESMKVWACLVVMLLCTPASAQVLTEKESTLVSNLTAARVLGEKCKDRYVFDKKKIALISKQYGVDIDAKKYSAEMKKQTALINRYYKEIGPKFCDFYYKEMVKGRMGDVIAKR